MQIIGLSGYARSGKDEAAKVLVNEFGFVRVAFADKLRDFLYALNPPVSHTRWVKSQSGKTFATKNPGGEEVLLQDVIDEYGWDGYKATPYGKEIRRQLQRLGTEAGRQTLWDSIWIDAAFAGLPEDAKVVVTDCRFPNEAQAIKERGGVVVRITRLGTGPAVGADGSVHPSETSLDDWVFDYRLDNTFDTVEQYHAYLRQFVDAYGEAEYFKNVIGDMV